MKLSEQYAAAMRAGNHDVAFAIERRQGLDGWPPELVSVGLLALERGEDPYRAIAEGFDAAVEDARAKAATDIENVGDASKLLAHSSEALTRRVYRRRGEKVAPTR